jgi:molybdate transport system substrate-binding protein
MMIRGGGRRFRARWFVVLLAMLSLVAVACGDDDDTSSSDTTVDEADALSGDIKVFAAASLTEAFTEMGKAFRAEDPDVTVTFNFAASSALATQINEGSPSDVFASADEANMKKVTDTGKASDPTVIARNTLSIAVEKGNPKAIKSLKDFDKSGVIYVVCAPEVPCGRYGQAALTKAGVTAKPASLEENVKAVVTKVDLGEADAGIVYTTDIKAAEAADSDVEGVAIAGADDPALVAVYPQAITTGSTNREVAEAWQEFVLSDDGQEILAEFGFLSP